MSNSVREQKQISPASDAPAASGYANLVWVWFLVQGVSSISLMIINKQLASQFPYASVIIAIQNAFSVPLFLIASHYRILPMNKIVLNHWLYSLPTTFCYVILLWTSIEGLSVVSVALAVIMRNLVPLLTGLIENIFFDLKLTARSYLSLAAIFVGSVFYSTTDKTLTTNGLQWLLLNTVCSVLIPIVEKRYLVSKLKDQTPSGINFYRNVLSVPMLLCIAALRGQLSEAMVELTELSSFSHLILLTSCIAGFTIGVAYYFLLKLTSNTSIAIANTFYKLLTLAASFVLWGMEFHYSGFLGIALSFAGITSYSLESSKKSAQPVPASPVLVEEKSQPEEVIVDMGEQASDEEKRH